MTVNALHNRLDALPRSERMPLLFLGHGNPMNAVEDNAWTAAWTRLGMELPRPQAVLCLSAHWLTEGVAVHTAAHPKTLHDFYGFPPELYAVRYGCPGAPTQAEAARELLRAEADTEWGLDHGSWSVLKRMYPDADVPVFQVSLDVRKSDREHFDLGAHLAALRERGVLIIGSGNLVHNLGRISFAPDAHPFDWAVEFDALAAGRIAQGDYESLIDYRALGTAAHLSVPTPDHYWPLLSVLGAARAAGANEKAQFPTEGIALGSVSMRAVLIR
ncbi:MAG: hypothetical protein RLZZ324_1007 [Candidatus Parcubacteria bacterium]|jgi:4,5-DOPA dioxygenase extradiol